MSYADPMSITIDGVTTSLPRVSSSGYTGEFTGYISDDTKITLKASHQYGKRVRRVLRLDHQTYAATDPYTSLAADTGLSIYTVFDLPVSQAYYPADLVKKIWDGYDALLNASSDAAITKLLGGES